MVTLISEIIYNKGEVIDESIENNTIFDIQIHTVPIKLQCIQKTLKTEGDVSIVKISLSPNISTIKEEGSFHVLFGDNILSEGRIIKIIK